MFRQDAGAIPSTRPATSQHQTSHIIHTHIRTYAYAHVYARVHALTKTILVSHTNRIANHNKNPLWLVTY